MSSAEIFTQQEKQLNTHKVMLDIYNMHVVFLMVWT